MSFLFRPGALPRPLLSPAPRPALRLSWVIDPRSRRPVMRWVAAPFPPPTPEARHGRGQ